MTDLDQALAEITAIRAQIARSANFHGYGPATLAATGVLALAAAAAQAIWLPDPAGSVLAYIGLWCATAALSSALIGIEMVGRAQRVHSGLAPEMIGSAVEQFLPAGAAGVLLTLVLLRAAPASLWMLPGLWQMVFALGVFASCRCLPRATFAVGVWYLAAGLACLALGGPDAFSPWAMGLPFGIGQLLVAAVLHRSQRSERHD